ncbi:MAG TPA: fluoride efflux transporter CrcB [Gemmatimonadaceae bacterium]|nr:fluoride efflux transporter CrcB [Gemmatimonadaceae bacterium]
MKTDLRPLLLVGLGGAIGSMARYGVGTFVQSRAGAEFPVATLLINVSGSFLLGFLMKLSLDTAGVSPGVQLLLATGVCGGFTTFSTFAYESVVLLERGEYGRAGMYAGGSVVLSIVATVLGIALARWLIAAGRFGVPQS